MILFYCPECGKEEMKSDYPLRKETTYVNMRDGYGRGIRHYKCECGNLLAGAMNVYGWENNDGMIGYAKVIIEGYNKGGLYYTDGLYEAVEEQYKEKLKLQF